MPNEAWRRSPLAWRNQYLKRGAFGHNPTKRMLVTSLCDFAANPESPVMCGTTSTRALAARIGAGSNRRVIEYLRELEQTGYIAWWPSRRGRPERSRHPLRSRYQLLSPTGDPTGEKATDEAVSWDDVLTVDDLAATSDPTVAKATEYSSTSDISDEKATEKATDASGKRRRTSSKRKGTRDNKVSLSRGVERLPEVAATTPRHQCAASTTSRCDTCRQIVCPDCGKLHTDSGRRCDSCAEAKWGGSEVTR